MSTVPTDNSYTSTVTGDGSQTENSVSKTREMKRPFRERYPVLADCLWRCADVEAPELWSTLRNSYEKHQPSKAFYEALRVEMMNAIVNGDVSPEDYESVTSDIEYSTYESVQAHLRELWIELFREPPHEID